MAFRIDHYVDRVVCALWFALSTVFRNSYRYRRKAFASDVRRALKTTPRGGVWRDLLDLDVVSTTMQIVWTARPVHPWDGNLPLEHRDTAFADQCLHDVDLAIARLFSQFQMVDRLDITVRHPISHASIVSGTAHRADFLAVQRLSIPMRLKMTGLTYELGRGGLRPLPEWNRGQPKVDNDAYERPTAE